MIVRDAILSEELYTVAGPATPAGTHRQLVRPRPLYRAPPLALAVPSAPTLASPDEPPALVTLVPVVAPVLTLEMVGAWLAAQEHDVLRELPQVTLELE